MEPTPQALLPRVRKAVSQLPLLTRAIAIVWQVARPWAVTWMLLLVCQGLLPVAIVYLTKLVVDAVVITIQARGQETVVKPVLPLVLILGALMLLVELIRGAINYVRTVQGELLTDHINSIIHAKSVECDLAFYEMADYYDHLHRARSEASHRPVALIDNLGALLQNGITLIAMGAILIPLGPLLTLALFLSTLPAFIVVVRYSLSEYQWRQRTTADERYTWYYDWLMTSLEAAAELRLFGLGKHFQSRYSSLRQRLRTERLQLTRRQSIAELAASLMALVIIGLAMVWMVWRTLHGSISLGQLALVYAAFNQGQRLMRTLLENVGQLYANSLFLGNLFEFLALEPLVIDASSEKATGPKSIESSIVFSNVTFQYPDATTKALDGFQMTIPGGQIVAIVGPNGAGKSTLVKLLCRFYDPNEGSVEIDDRNLKNIPLKHLRSLITVLFQTPFHYNTTVRENILYGELDADFANDRVNAAIRAAGAEEIVARLPNGPDTLLGKWFAGGTELSVGEWQRIALARAFLRQAPIIILDEPTSALDPWAEADWLLRFRKLAQGRTALIITHRFTTAMHADIIHVMNQGRIVESGTHEELLLGKGLYAGSWSQQMKSADVGLFQEIR